MKVYQIISEASPRLVQDAGKWKWKLPDGSMLGGFADQKAAMDWGKNNPAALNPAAPASTPKTTTPATPKQAAQAKVDAVKKAADRMQKGTIDPIKKLNIRSLKNKKIEEIWATLKASENAKGLTKYNKWLTTTGGKLLAGLRIAGLTVIVADYYIVTSAMEDAYQDSELTDEEFKDLISRANGFLTAELAVIATELAASAAISAKLAQGVIRTFQISSAGATFGASILSLIVTEIGFNLLLAFITSAAGRDWIVRYYMLPLITGVGSLESIVWDKFTDYFSRQKDKQTATTGSKELAAAKASGDPAKVAAAKKAIEDAKAAADSVAARNRGAAAFDKL